LKKKKYLLSSRPPNSLNDMKALTQILKRSGATKTNHLLSTPPKSPILKRVSLLAISLAALVAFPATANALKLTDLVGYPVETDSGDKLGNIEDFSIDPETGDLQFVVISIGSFLVENSLIAVDPDALSQAANGDPVVLRMDDLEVAHRFNADNWPDAADVRSVESKDSEDSDGDSSGSSSSALSSTGTATITSGSRKATYENGKREIVNGPIRRTSQNTSYSSSKSKRSARPQRSDRVVPNFKNLDSNKDGRLSRSEIGAQLNQRSGFKELDADNNGSIDDFEYEAYQQRQATQIHRRWVGNR